MLDWLELKTLGAEDVKVGKTSEFTSANRATMSSILNAFVVIRLINCFNLHFVEAFKAKVFEKEHFLKFDN